MNLMLYKGENMTRITLIKKLEKVAKTLYPKDTQKQFRYWNDIMFLLNHENDPNWEIKCKEIGNVMAIMTVGK